MTGSLADRASKGASETAKQIFSREEDDDEEDEQKEKEKRKFPEIAAQVVFPGGRGVAQKADLVRDRPMERAAADVFTETGSR